MKLKICFRILQNAKQSFITEPITRHTETRCRPICYEHVFTNAFWQQLANPVNLQTPKNRSANEITVLFAKAHAQNYS